MTSKIVSHYEILDKLGEGGMGAVYKAEDLKLARTVALKFLPAGISSTPDDRTRLLTEARSAAALNHPGICSVFDILEHDGEPFIVMEYVEGKTLRKEIEDGRLKIEDCIRYGLQIAEALNAAHRRGILHRDVKPENVMITADGRVKVMDFGLARRPGGTRVTREGAVLGTAAYMSPEQARGETVDARTDLWSFGVLLYELSTGKLPFASEYDQAVIYGILHETPKPPRELNADLPEPLERIIRRCMEKSPAGRYQTMEECLSDLRAIAAVQGAAGSPPAVSGKKRRFPTLLAAIITGIAVLAVATIVFLPRPKNAAEKSSIAVLPFRNLGDNEADAYFAEGLTEDIISQLGTARGLKVIGHSSVLRFRNTEKPYQEIAAELGVSTLLEGSIRHVGDRLRVVARLIDHVTGQDLWSDTYDRNLHDILAIQSDIAGRISAALRLQILPDTTSSHGRPLNLEAWRLYQQGRSEWYKRSPEALRAAIGYFEKSIEADPDFALAHAGLADAFALLGDNGVVEVPPAEAFRKAKQEALRALSLDDNLAEAHASLGHLQIHEFQWEQAERSLRRAVELNPSSPITQMDLGLYCSAVGKNEETVERLQNAMLLDPLSIYTTSTAAAVYLRMGRSDSAIAILNRMLRIEPSSPRLHYVLGWAYSADRPEEAVKEFQFARGMQNDADVRVSLAQAYAHAGRREEALSLVDSLTGNRTREFVDPARVAVVYAVLGRKDDALTWLETALREESAAIIFIKTDPWFADLRSEPRFAAMLKQMGFPPVDNRGL